MLSTLVSTIRWSETSCGKHWIIENKYPQHFNLHWSRWTVVVVKVDISQGKYLSQSNCAAPGSLTVMFRQQRKQLIIKYSLTTLGKIGSSLTKSWQTRAKNNISFLFGFQFQLLVCVFLTLALNERLKEEKSNLAGPLSEIFSGHFEDPLDLQSPPTHLTLCGILVNISDETKPRQQLESLLEFSYGTPLHLIIITDEASISGAADIIGSVLSREISHRLIKQAWNKRRPIPPVKVRWN